MFHVKSRAAMALQFGAPHLVLWRCEAQNEHRVRRSPADHPDPAANRLLNVFTWSRGPHL